MSRVRRMQKQLTIRKPGIRIRDVEIALLEPAGLDPFLQGLERVDGHLVRPPATLVHPGMAPEPDGRPVGFDAEVFGADGRFVAFEVCDLARDEALREVGLRGRAGVVGLVEADARPDVVEDADCEGDRRPFGEGVARVCGGCNVFSRGCRVPA